MHLTKPPTTLDNPPFRIYLLFFLSASGPYHGKCRLNAGEMLRMADTDAAEIDATIHANEAAQDASEHGGVPLMVFDGIRR